MSRKEAQNKKPKTKWGIQNYELKPLRIMKYLLMQSDPPIFLLKYNEVIIALTSIPVKIVRVIPSIKKGSYARIKGLTVEPSAQISSDIVSYIKASDLRSLLISKLNSFLSENASFKYYCLLFLNIEKDNSLYRIPPPLSFINDGDPYESPKKKIKVNKKGEFVKETNITEYLFLHYLNYLRNSGVDLHNFTELVKGDKGDDYFNVTLKFEVMSEDDVSKYKDDYIHIIKLLKGMGVDIRDDNDSNMKVSNNHLILFDFQSIDIANNPIEFNNIYTKKMKTMIEVRSIESERGLKKFIDWIREEAKEYLEEKQQMI